LFSGNASNGSSGSDRMVHRPQRRPRRISSSRGMLAFVSPRPVHGLHEARSAVTHRSDSQLA
jgi:hypothetical protein